jgi:hypothetical protein
MAATGFTPIQLYRTATAAAAPTAGNLADGELAINTLDEKLYFKNSAGTVKLLAANLNAVPNGGTGLATTTAYSVVFTGTTSTGAFQASAGPGAAGQILTSNGAGALPTFQAAPASGASKGQAIAFSIIFGL